MPARRWLTVLVLLFVPILMSGAPAPRVAAKKQPVLSEKSRWMTDYANQPVKWIRWGSAAFDRARVGTKPIVAVFGEVGCLRCRKSMRETFANPAIADQIAKAYTPVLIDRNEFPELASAYGAPFEFDDWMEPAPQVVILTPDLLPIAELGRMTTEQMLNELTRIAAQWSTDRDPLLQVSRTILARAYGRLQPAPAEGELPEESSLIATLTNGYDEEHPGFEGAPRLPQAGRLLAMWRLAERSDSSRTRERVTRVLSALERGGIRDQIGGGIHRAAIDRDWRMPLFEKRLVDQVLVAEAALEVWEATKRDQDFDFVRTTLDFVVRDLQVNPGMFASALDSESFLPVDRERLLYGVYYAWQLSDMENAFGRDLGKRVAAVWGITREGNIPAELDVTGTLRGWSIPQPRIAAADDAPLTRALSNVLIVRLHRPMPAADLAPIASSSGLAMSVLARAGRLLNEVRYVEAAAAAGRVFISARDPRTKGRLRTPGTNVPASIDDHAMLALGFLDLYEASADLRWLDAAIDEVKQLEPGWNEARGSYAIGAGVPEELRPLLKEGMGLSLPQNASAAIALLRVGRVTGNVAWIERAARILSAQPESVSNVRTPAAAIALDLLQAAPRSKQVFILGSSGLPAAASLAAVVRSPYSGLLYANGKKALSQLAVRVPLAATLQLPEAPDAVFAYVCQDGRCSSAITDPLQLASRLQ
jgi:uncharacterized protein